MHNLNHRYDNYFSQMLNHCAFFALFFLCYTIPWALEKKDNCGAENGSKIRLIIACKARFLLFSGSKSPLLRILWGNCNFSLLLHLDMTLQLFYVKVESISQHLLFCVISVNLKAWFLIILVCYKPKNTQIELTRQLISSNSFQAWQQFSFFCIYPQCYMNSDLNLGLFNE